MIKIEKGIKIPKRFDIDKYPFAKMNVGDSFLVDYTSTNKAAVWMSLTNYLRKFNHINKSHYKIASRTIEGNKIRVWRIQ